MSEHFIAITLLRLLYCGHSLASTLFQPLANTAAFQPLANTAALDPSNNHLCTKGFIMAYLRIGQLSARTGINNETLRFYEARGLMGEPRRSDAGYRLYTEQDVKKAEFIVRAKKMGFGLKDIAELLSLRVERESSTCGEVKNLAESKLVEIEAKIKELECMKVALEQITEACCGGEESAVHCTILNALDQVEDVVRAAS